MLHCGACIPVMWTGKRPERKERLETETEPKAEREPEPETETGTEPG